MMKITRHFLERRQQRVDRSLSNFPDLLHRTTYVGSANGALLTVSPPKKSRPNGIGTGDIASIPDANFAWQPDARGTQKERKNAKPFSPK